jgi:hypothetical protein
MVYESFFLIAMVFESLTLESNLLAFFSSLSLGLASLLVSFVLLILAMSVDLKFRLVFVFIRFLSLAFFN